ncbi:MAG: GAF domain-containing protein [Anaerolineae bacterium]|nr:GAF domain-containing protein [Anaerolineae bacterium]
MTGPSSVALAHLFREVVSLVLHSAELDETLPRALREVRVLMPESTIGLYRYWPRTEELELITVVPDEDTQSLVGTRFSLEGWRPGEVVRTRRAIHIPSIKLKSDAPAVDLLCAPVLGVNRDVLGVLQAASTRPNAFLDEDLDTLVAVASLVGLAEENERRGEALQAAAINRAQAEYIAAMADMTSHITHRVVNEMGAIRLAVQVLQRQHERGKLSDQDFKEKLDGIEHNASDTINVVRRIQRPFDKIDTVAVQLEPMLDDVLEKLIPPDLLVIRQSAVDLPAVLATRHLAEVFHHLISNALDAMSSVDDKRLIVITRCADAEHIEVVLEDNGVGLSEEMREGGLFRLGVTDKRESMGYGLWWSRLYLSRIGGALDTEPAAGRGARFTVRVRTAEENPLW